MPCAGPPPKNASDVSFMHSSPSPQSEFALHGRPRSEVSTAGVDEGVGVVLGRVVGTDAVSSSASSSEPNGLLTSSS